MRDQNNTELFSVPSFSLTDAEWEARDAEVARLREMAATPIRSIDRVEMAVGRGLSRRALLVASGGNLDMTSPPLAAIAAWHTSHPSEGIAVLSGPPGCGKTVAAVWWGLEVGAVSVRAAAFAAASRYDNEIRSGWLAARAMVLDDLGTEYNDAKGSFSVDLDDLIDVKYSDMSRLVITTNLTAPAFRSRYGERVADRIRECGSWLESSSGSLRRRT